MRLLQRLTYPSLRPRFACIGPINAYNDTFMRNHDEQGLLHNGRQCLDGVGAQ
jgi:hypothetical protein